MEIAADSLDGSVIFHAPLTKSQDSFSTCTSKSLRYHYGIRFALRRVQGFGIGSHRNRGEANASEKARRPNARSQTRDSKVPEADARRFSFPSSAQADLGGSSLRPQHVYELSFPSSGNVVPPPSGEERDFVKSRAAEVLSRNGAGSASYPGPSKLFLLVKAPSSFIQPLHFLPKRDFRYNNKIVPMRLSFIYRTKPQNIDHSSQTGSCGSLVHSTPDGDDFIWFQCRHVIKGLAFNTEPEGE